ncbi:MAG: hypothetical protein HYU66_04670 [Armatimonadetes bacterium]|nr:hypothetical protein [Armatimonadota bacterium]
MAESSDSAARRLHVLAWSLVAVAGGWYCYTYFWLALHVHLRYPYELEWMESQRVVTVQRLLQGQPLYVAPSVDYVPSIYAPLYYYVGVVAVRLGGLGYGPLRMVSVLSTLGGATLAVWLAGSRAPRSLPRGLVAAIFLYATYGVVSGFPDAARVDALAVFLLLSTVAAFRAEAAWAHSGLAPLLMVLTVMAKQNTVLVAAALAAWCLVFRRGLARWVFPVSVPAAIVAITLWMNHCTDGWFGYYLWHLPRMHPLIDTQITTFWVTDLCGHAGVACAFAMYWLLAGDHRDRGEAWLDRLLAAAAVAASWAARSKLGGAPNTVMLAYGVIAVYFAAGVGLAIRRAGRNEAIGTAVAVAVLIQLGALYYNPRTFRPSHEARWQGERFVRLLAATPGDVFVPSHSWYAAMAGKPTCANATAMDDVLNARGEDAVIGMLRGSVLGALRAHRFGAVVLDEPDQFPGGSPELHDNYVLVDGNLTTEAFTPVMGNYVHPRFLYMPRAPAPQAGGLPSSGSGMPKTSRLRRR